MTNYPAITPGMMIDLMQGTQPTIVYEFKDRAGDTLVITGKTIKLAVKRDIEDLDSAKLFDLQGTVTSGPSGLVSFAFTGVHTGLAGTYVGELRRWASGSSTNRLPEDAYDVSFNVNPAVVRIET